MTDETTEAEERPETTGEPAETEHTSGTADTAEAAGSEREAEESTDLDEGEGEEADDLDPVAAERDELRETLQRVQADFENFRKRTMRDQAAQVDRAAETLIEQLLPVLDSFELAVLNVPEDDLDDSSQKLRKGVELVYAELLSVLEKAGLERIDPVGTPFDPEEHEAVMREGDGQVVTEVMRTGYRLKGRVVRPAMVKVGEPANRESG